PSRFAAALTAGIERGFQNCRRYMAAGVHWGVVDNNFTADGRFLDLEVPVVLGGPAFGVLQKNARPEAVSAASRWVGLEAVGYAHTVRLFVEDALARLKFLVASRALQNALVRRFAVETVRELERAMPPSHLSRSPRALLKWVFDSIAGPLQLGVVGR